MFGIGHLMLGIGGAAIRGAAGVNTFDEFDALSAFSFTLGGTDTTVTTNSIASMAPGDSLLVFAAGSQGTNLRTANLPTGDGWTAPTMTERYDDAHSYNSTYSNLSMASGTATDSGSSRAFTQTWSGSLYGPGAGVVHVPRGAVFVQASPLATKNGGSSEITATFNDPSAANSLVFLHVHQRDDPTFAAAGWTELFNINNGSNSGMALFYTVGAITSKTVTSLVAGSGATARLTEWTRP